MQGLSQYERRHKAWAGRQVPNTTKDYRYATAVPVAPERLLPYADNAGEHTLDELKVRIPSELLSYRQWVAFKTLPSEKPGRLKKIPVDPHTGGNADTGDSKTWGTIEQAITRAKRDNLPGIGFVFSKDDPFFGMDLDECREPDTGRIEGWAQEDATLLDSYTEVSFSGTGVHVLGRGKLPPGGRRKGRIEIYDCGRFFVVTGHHVAGTPTALEDRSGAVASLHAKVFGEQTPTPEPQSASESPIALDDRELINRAMRAKNGSNFLRLWDGDISGYGSHSEADLALCSHLAFWTGGDPQQMDRLFRQSGLYRPKWDDKHFSDGRTYGQGTVGKAIETTREFYSPDRRTSTRMTSAPANETVYNFNPAVGRVKYLADAVVKYDHFAADTGGNLYHFADGVYRPGGRDFIKRLCKEYIEAWRATPHWSPSLASQVVEYIRTDAPELWGRPPLDLVNVKNGLLNVETRELSPHRPDYLSAVQLPVEYDPEADCPAWQRFVESTFPTDCQRMPWELIAWLMTPDTSVQKAVLLLGDGQNGKSTFLAAVQAFLGRENVAATSLHKLESDRFTTAHLVGKLANICPDLPSEHLAGTSVFKSLTGGDRIHAERKYGESFEFEPFARLVFSANYPPQSADASKAFFRRWLVVPFKQTFSGRAEIPRNVLDAQLADPRELSGVLNMALDALLSIRRSGLTESDSMRAARDEFRQVTDPIVVWLDNNTVEGPEAYVVKGELLRAYNEDARANGRPPMTDTQFSQAVTQWNPRVQGGQKRLGDARPKVWHRIGLKSTERGA